MRVVLAKNAYGTAPNPNLSTSISCFWLVSGRSRGETNFALGKIVSQPPCHPAFSTYCGRIRDHLLLQLFTDMAVTSGIIIRFTVTFHAGGGMVLCDSQ
jgi:hypothetical protein